MRAALIVFGSLMLGCSVNITIPTGLKCGDEVCPVGQRCEVGFCVADGAQVDSGAQVDANQNFDAGALVRECGGAAAYTQNFDSPDSAWFFENFPPGASIDGSLRIEVPEGGELTSAFSDPRIDIVDSHWFARVTPSDTGLTTVGLKHGGEFLTIEIAGGNISFEVDFDEETVLPYDSTAHRFVGFREASGTLHFVTSPDGVSFSVQRSVSSPLFVRRAQAYFAVEGSGAISEFDDINGGVATTYGFCPSSKFSDDFEGPDLSEQWSIFGGCTEVVQANGEVSLIAEVGDFCVIEMVGLHDLTNSELVLELGSAFSGYYKFAVDGEFNEFVVERFGTELRATNCREGVCELPMSMPYAGERFLRFSGNEDGTVVFAFSPDGDVYTDIRTSSAFDISRVKARFHGNTGTENRITGFN